MIDLRIVFMGTPDFAVASLRALIDNAWPIVAVVTAPDRKKGRGQTVIPSPVKELALQANLPVLQPTNLKDDIFIEELKAFRANLQIVVAFRMLPEVVWSMPDLGSFNLHASLLPNYRGAAPINWAIINGEKETGVTTFFLQHKIDTGEIIFQEKEQIKDNDTVGSLHYRLMEKGSKLVLKTVEVIASECVDPKPQQADAEVKEAPKIFKETCKIDWHKPIAQVRNFVRGLNPYPAAWTILNNDITKVFWLEKSTYDHDAPIGSILTDHRSIILVKALDGWVELKELQLAGKRRMNTADLLRGNSMENIDSIKPQI